MTIHDPVSYQLPTDLSTHGQFVDELFGFIFWLSVVFFVGIVGAMCWFVWKYRKRPGHKSEPVRHGLSQTLMELSWTLGPVPVLIYLFHAGFVGYMKLSIAPPDAIQIRVKASQWNWQFEYPNGESDDSLHVPSGKPVKLIMSSSDVLHAFYVPELRTKRDVVPGMYTSTWFTAKSPAPVADEGKACTTFKDCGDGSDDKGETCDAGHCTAFVDLLCAQYCGGKSKDPSGNELNGDLEHEGQADGFKGHFSMHAKVFIQSNDVYQAYLKALEGGPNVTPEQRGAKIYAKKTCITCHTIDGTSGTGPSWKGVWGKDEKLDEGSSKPDRVVDEQYVTDSILDPSKDVVLRPDGRSYGRPSAMPARLITDQKDIDAVIAYLKTLK